MSVFEGVTAGLRIARTLVFGCAALVVAHAVWVALDPGGPTLQALFNDWIYNAAFAAAAAACLLRAALTREDRAAWICIGGGLALWAVGELYWTIQLSDLDTIPYPSPADALYLSFYPLLFAGIVLLTSARLPRLGSTLWLDGAIGAVSVAALAAALVYPAIRSATDGDVAAVATNLAYPVADLMLLGFAVAALALTGWRPGPSWMLLTAALAVTAVADSYYLYYEATSSYLEGTLFDSLWMLGALLFACAAWGPTPRPARRQLQGLRMLVMPTTFALAALGLLVYAQFETLNGLTLGLATATLFGVIVRMVVSYGQNLTLTAALGEEAVRDALTGLRNRRGLMRDLVEFLAGHDDYERAVLVLLDLDGFKSYNDVFGHPAGDALLSRLGHRLQNYVEGRGHAYRIGGDEFCVLASAREDSPAGLAASVAEALFEHGEGFTVNASYGVVLLPVEADQPSEALRKADARMYARKGRARASAGRQTTDALVSVLAERHPELGIHLSDVADLCRAVADRLGLTEADVGPLLQAAALHDIGKAAIPDAILGKPGPLDDEEWAFMRRHTLIGERILGSAPALAPAARLVRSSHERFDGGGYPDGLARDEIPLGARIIAVCDAHDAMTSNRPYRTAMSAEGALSELRRGAGSQFDPRVVDAFCAVIADQQLRTPA